MNIRYREYHFFPAVILDARGAETPEIGLISLKTKKVEENGG